MTMNLTPESVDFLRTVFGERWEDAWVCWKGHMAGRRVRDLWVNEPPLDEDTYFSIALLKAGATGRTNEEVERVRALVIDDVGTKIDPMFMPAADWVIETSPGNYQYGWCIDGDREDYEAFRRRMKAHPIWGASDGVDAVHLFRLPQGRNTKDGRDFTVHGLMTKNRGDFNDLIAGLPEVGSPQGSAGGSEPGRIEDAKLLEALVNLIPNTGTDRQDWVNTAHAVWGASAGAGFEAFAQWSAKWTQGTDDPAANWKLWQGIKASGIGRWWLIKAAGAAGEAWAVDEAKSVFDDGVAHPAQPPGAVPGAIDPVQGMVANSIRLAMGHRMRNNHDSGCWHVFSSGIWKPCPKSRKEGFVRAEQWAQANAMGLLPGAFKEVMKANFYDGVENILKQKMAIRQVDFDRDIWLLGTPGGTVDLKTGTLSPADPKDFISKSCAVTPSEKADCPRWKRFISEITKGDLMAATFLQQWLGYCLTGDTTEQKFLFLYGPGGNGKSVLMDTVAWIMADYFVKPVADLYFAKGGQRHMQEVAMLAGARLITVSEVPPNAAWDEGKLKDHTGGGMITANFMRQNSFSFVPQFKLTALGNHQPTFPGGMNEAIKRRFNLMLLDYKPKVADPGLMKAFQSEAAGILRWMIEGLTDPQNGWLRGRLVIPTAVQAATDAFVHDQDALGLWLEDRIEKRPGTLVSSTDLFNDWAQWRQQNGVVGVYENQTSFAAEMGRRGFRKVKTNKNNGYADIALISKAKTVF